jgi:hypothetical protein
VVRIKNGKMHMKMKKINVQKGSRNEGKRDEKYLKKKRQRTDSIGSVA